MLLPRKTKYRKIQKGRIGGTASRGIELMAGSYGLQALEPGRVNANQIESARRAMTRHIKRGGKIWIRIFPHIAVTAKPNEVPMGGGKGNPEFFVARVRAGTIMFEMDGVQTHLAREAMRLAANKLPLKTRFLIRHQVDEEGGE